MSRYSKLKIAIVLGAGGARGLAHLGVLEELENHNIPISLIVGASIGSLIGAFYADTRNSKHLKTKLLKLSSKEILDFSILNTLQFFVNTKAPFEGKLLEDFVNKHLTTTEIQNLKIPLFITATDIISGQPVILDKGNIGKAVRASSALPPIFSPFKYQGKSLIDGGLSLPVPVSIAREQNPDVVIAIDVSNTMPHKKIRNMIDVIYKSKCINYYWLSRAQAATADIDIHPALDRFDVLDDKHNEEIYMLGRMAAKKSIPRILSLLDSKLAALGNNI